MKCYQIPNKDPRGGVTPTTIVIERNDPIEYLEEHLGDHKIIDELKYMGIKTIGQFADEFDDIIKRVIDRFPSFFDGEDLGVEEIRDVLSAVDMKVDGELVWKK